MAKKSKKKEDETKKAIPVDIIMANGSPQHLQILIAVQIMVVCIDPCINK